MALLTGSNADTTPLSVCSRLATAFIARAPAGVVKICDTASLTFALSHTNPPVGIAIATNDGKERTQARTCSPSLTDGVDSGIDRPSSRRPAVGIRKHRDSIDFHIEETQMVVIGVLYYKLYRQLGLRRR